MSPNQPAPKERPKREPVTPFSVKMRFLDEKIIERTRNFNKWERQLERAHLMVHMLEGEIENLRKQRVEAEADHKRYLAGEIKAP